MPNDSYYTKPDKERQDAHATLCQMHLTDSASENIQTGEQLAEYMLGGQEFKPSMLLNDMYYLSELPNGGFYIGARMIGMVDHVEALSIIQKLIEFYTEVSPEAIYDMAQMIEENERQLRRSVARTSVKTRIKREGFVYLLKSPTGYYKIGRTKDPKNRRETFSVKLPFEVEFEHLIETDDMETLEMELHGRFSAQRINGEWFSLSVDDVAYIKSIGGAG